VRGRCVVLILWWCWMVGVWWSKEPTGT